MKERMGAARPHRPTGIEEVGKMPTLLEDTGGTPTLPLKKRLPLRSIIHNPLSTIHDPPSTIFLREVLCALRASVFRFCPAISRTVSLGHHAKREWAWRLETTATVEELAETLAMQNLEQNVPRTDWD
jgi:hypothetical protein